MMISPQLAAHASALLVMNHGNPCSIAEFAFFLEQYGYAQDPADAQRFVFTDAGDGDTAGGHCAIVLRDLSAPVEAMDIFGQDIGHFTNLNYLMQKAGWAECAVVCADDDVAAKLLARLVSVEVGDTAVAMPAARPPSPARPANDAGDTRDAEEADEAGAAPDGKIHARLRELTAQYQAMELRNAELRNAHWKLTVRNEQLEHQLQDALRPAAAAGGEPARAPVADPAPDALLRIIEKHLLPRFELSSQESAETLRELRAIGYDVQLRLVRATPPDAGGPA